MDTQDFVITPLRRQIIETLYIIRGANADVLMQYIDRKLNCTSQEKKQIINQLHRLKEKGILASKKLEGKHAGSMYFLSAKGFELAKRLLDIKPLQKGSMWIKYQYPFNQHMKDGLRDFDYDSYKPPIRQYKHHHLILRSIVSLFGIDSGIQPYSFRLTLDSFKKYICEGKECVLKPDAEFVVGNSIYTLEIDRSTESYAQLVQKFNNYKRFLDYENTKEEAYRLHKIIFVIDDTERDYGMSRRWGTIFKAYLEGMEVIDYYNSWPNIDIVLTTVSELANVIKHDIYIRESSKESLAQTIFGVTVDSGIFKGDEVIYYHCENTCAFYFYEKGNKIVYFAYYPYYTSAFYRYLTDYYSNATSYLGLSYDYKELDAFLVSEIKRQNWLIDWGKSSVNRELKRSLNIRLDLVQYINAID